MVKYPIPPQLQASFDAHLSAERVSNSRLICLLASVLYAVFVFMDMRMAPSAVHTIWLIRAIEIAFTMAVFGITYFPVFVRNYSFIMLTFFLASGLGAEAVVYFAGPHDLARNFYPIGGIAMVAMGLYTFSFLPVLRQAFIGITLVVAYILLIIYTHDPSMEAEWPILTTNCYILAGINVIGIFAASQRNRYIRESFLLRHNLITDLERTEAEKRQSQFWSEHDSLTSLPNRKSLMHWLDNHIPLILGSGKILALLFIDLDEFKAINDNLGHAVGDEVLKAVANRLGASVRKKDLVARLGGDEFVVVLTLDAESREIATRIAGSILANIERPIRNISLQRRLSASIGIAFFPDHADDANTLLKIADRHMYEAKRKGKGVISITDQ